MAHIKNADDEPLPGEGAGVPEGHLLAMVRVRGLSRAGSAGEGGGARGKGQGGGNALAIVRVHGRECRGAGEQVRGSLCWI